VAASKSRTKFGDTGAAAGELTEILEPSPLLNGILVKNGDIICNFH
jgi:hypothetical protein